MYFQFDLHMTYLSIIVTVGVLNEVQRKLKIAYKALDSSEYPHCYIKLALVRDEMYAIRDKKLNEITRHTLQGQVDEILKIKEPITLEDVFHYNNLPCPRLLLILGAPGKHHHLYLMCVYVVLLHSYS